MSLNKIYKSIAMLNQEVKGRGTEIYRHFIENI